MALEPVERGVHSCQRDVTPRNRLDLPGNRDTVGLVADTECRKENHELEVGQQLAWHLFTNYEYEPAPRQARPGGPPLVWRT